MLFMLGKYGSLCVNRNGRSARSQGEWFRRLGRLQCCGHRSTVLHLFSLLVAHDEIRPMKPLPTSPNTSDADAAVRIALVREMTEAARSGAIGWSVRDRRLRALFCIESNSRAFDSSRPC